jgi:hypothetical protein
MVLFLKLGDDLEMMRIRSAPFRLGIIMLTLLFPLSLVAADGFQEDFAAGLGKEGLPKGWELKQWFGNTRKIETVKEEGTTALHLVSNGNSFGVYREKDLNPKKTPILTWQWKVTRLPEGADVRDKKKDDQAAQIYVMFPRFPKMVNTRLVGYIWETSAPKMAKVTSQKSSNTRYIVLQSGPENLGKWVTETRNVYEDYKTLFGEEPPEIGGITIMIDSDDTNSSAESYFTNIRLEKEG